MAALLVKENGNHSRMADRLGIARQVLSRKLARAGLLVESELQRALHGVSGKRSGLVGGMVDVEAVRVQLLDALARTWNWSAAAALLGWKRRTMGRRIRKLVDLGRGITDAEIMARRRALNDTTT